MQSHEHDHTGSHTIPPPPRVPTIPSSEPPISKRGLSWKAIASVASILFALAGSAGTYVYTHAEERAVAQARHREIIARLDRIEDVAESAAARDARHERVDAMHDTRIAVHETRLAAAERAIAKNDQRRRRREEE